MSLEHSAEVTRLSANDATHNLDIPPTSDHLESMLAIWTQSSTDRSARLVLPAQFQMKLREQKVSPYFGKTHKLHHPHCPLCTTRLKTHSWIRTPQQRNGLCGCHPSSLERTAVLHPSVRKDILHQHSHCGTIATVSRTTLAKTASAIHRVCLTEIDLLTKARVGWMFP